LTGRWGLRPFVPAAIAAFPSLLFSLFPTLMFDFVWWGKYSHLIKVRQYLMDTKTEGPDGWLSHPTP
jgi:hypothetical protein